MKILTNIDLPQLSVFHLAVLFVTEPKDNLSETWKTRAVKVTKVNYTTHS